MNYFAHGYRFLDDPYYLAGTAVPDWLSVSDRRVRVRSKHAATWADDPDPRTRALARGIAQHHHDDHWFHQTRAFAELSLELSALLREVLPEEAGHRRWFLGHILVELLLDSELIAEDPARLEQYYGQMSQADAGAIEQRVNQMAPRTAERLSWFIDGFVQVKFLWDYQDDDKLLFRLNQVMQRVNLPQLPHELTAVLPTARSRVADRRKELLTEPG